MESAYAFRKREKRLDHQRDCRGPEVDTMYRSCGGFCMLKKRLGPVVSSEKVESRGRVYLLAESEEV